MLQKPYKNNKNEDIGK